MKPTSKEYTSPQKRYKEKYIGTHEKYHFLQTYILDKKHKQLPRTIYPHPDLSDNYQQSEEYTTPPREQYKKNQQSLFTPKKSDDNIPTNQ